LVLSSRACFIGSEIERFGKIVKAVGVKVEQ